MRNPLKYSIVGLTAMLAFSCGIATAQNKQPAKQNATQPEKQQGPFLQYGGGQEIKDEGPGGPAPVRDFNGTWKGAMEAKLTNKIPPMTPAGQAALKLNIPDPFSASSNDPWKVCDPFGMPRSVNNQNGQLGFATMPDRIIILESFAKAWREIWTDGRELPKNVGHKGGPSTMWFGYSVGHWEGDTTLVVDTIGMDERTWVDRRGYPHSTDAHVIERYTRVDHNHLKVTETLDDPTYYSKPFEIAETDYQWLKGQDDPKVAIPFSAENICVSSEALDYLKLMADPADEDSAVGNKKK